MTTKEILEQLDMIYRQRLLEAHHDSYDLHKPDLDALTCVTDLLKILSESSPNDSIKVGELLAASNIER